MNNNKVTLSRRESLFPQSGSVLCGYYIGETLGQGAFGKVKKAYKLSDKKYKYPYAVKFIDKSQLSDLDDVERIYRESAILTSLKHPNIIRLLEVLDSNKYVLIIMEYASGGELLDHINTKQNKILTELEACRIFNSIINALEYCHRRKVIHRDLKLENILLDSKGNIKIADFGLSNTVSFGKTMDTSCGTPSYIAPEIIKNEIKHYSSACDIWSLGVILYTMICGFLPFEASNLSLLYKKILSVDYILPNYISIESKSIIKYMLNIDPNKRINLSQIRNNKWTLMEINSLKNNLKKFMYRPTIKEIKDAHNYNLTRNYTYNNDSSICNNNSNNNSIENNIKVNIATEDDHKLNLESPTKNQSLFSKHRQSMSKSCNNSRPESIKSIDFLQNDKSSSISPKKERNRNTLNVLKNKLSKLKVGNYTNSSQRRRNDLSLSNLNSLNKQSERFRNTLRTPNTYRSKERIKDKKLKDKLDSSPITNKQYKKMTYTSPIIDSIMKRNRRNSQDDFIINYFGNIVTYTKQKN